MVSVTNEKKKSHWGCEQVRQTVVQGRLTVEKLSTFVIAENCMHYYIYQEKKVINRGTERHNNVSKVTRVINKEEKKKNEKMLGKTNKEDTINDGHEDQTYQHQTDVKRLNR